MLKEREERGRDVEGERKELERVKRGSVSQLLMRCGRLLNEEGVRRLEEKTGVPIRASHTALFAHIDLDGTRLTVLAQRVGVTKQAVGQLVDELEKWGVLERIPDPQDGRARLVRFVGGARGLLSGMDVLRELDGELAARVGEDRWGALHEVLLALEAHLDPARS